MRRVAAVGLAAGLALAACGGAPAPPPIARPGPARWLRVQAATRRATISLVLGYDGRANGLNVDGAVKGALAFDVPVGWQMRVRCINRSTRRAACAIGVSPGSSSPPLARGVPGPPSHAVAPGGVSSFLVSASRPGVYRLVALIGGAVPPGMWVVLRTAAHGSPSVRWLR